MPPLRKLGSFVQATDRTNAVDERSSMERLLSFSEISMAMTCQAQHDFAYGDQLAGSSLTPKRFAPLLVAGKAWGAAVAAYHVNVEGLAPGMDARAAMDAMLDQDVAQQREAGVYSAENFTDLRQRLLSMLLHYIEIGESWKADPILERRLVVPIPSRKGGRASNRYKLLSYLDATRTDRTGRVWLIEFKLRKSLTSVEMIQLNRQIRIYAWAWWQHTGIKPAGVEVIERLNEVPRPARLLAKGGPSHDKSQLCTAEAYEAACLEHRQPMLATTIDALTNRKWQQIVPIIFRDGELEEAGRELVSAAKLIRDLDSGELWPVRNAKPQNCRGCRFREICPSPDNELVDALYERVPAKRSRVKEQN